MEAAAPDRFADAELDSVVGRIDASLVLLQEALRQAQLPGAAGSGASALVGGGNTVASPSPPPRRRRASPRRQARPAPKRTPAAGGKAAAAASPRKGGASTLDASAYTAAHGTPARRVANNRSARLASPPRSSGRQLRSPERTLGSPGRRLAVDVSAVSASGAADDPQRPSSFGAAGRFQGAHSSSHFMEGADYTSAAPAYVGLQNTSATFGSRALGSPERRARALGSPDRSGRRRSPQPRGAAASSAALALAEQETFCEWWDAHRTLTNELYGAAASTAVEGRPLPDHYLGLYAVLRRTAIRSTLKVSSATVGSLNPGAVVEVLEARVRGDADRSRVHVRIRSRYGKSSMAICGWANLVTKDGHTLMRKLADDEEIGRANGSADVSTTVMVKKKKKKKRKKKRAVVAVVAAEVAEVGIGGVSREEVLRLGGPNRADRKLQELQAETAAMAIRSSADPVDGDAARAAARGARVGSLGRSAPGGGAPAPARPAWQAK